MSGEKKLAVLLFGARLGTLTCDRNGKLGFVYHDGARSKRHAMPLSLSLPLLRREHGHAPVDAFLWGLLPDNENVLDRWGREFHVSSRNPFALLAHVGEDCAGAVQIVSEERAASIEGPGPVRVEWLTEAGVAERLRSLRVDETAWSRADDEGRFSLAGAQPKVALFHDGDRWGIPIGRTPTTHILKPPAGGWDGQIENEHFCLRLARRLGLPVASSAIVRFGSETAIAVERYDRVRITPEWASAEAALAAAEAAAAAARAAGTDDSALVSSAARDAADAAARAAGFEKLAETQPVLRLHQEDLCQALGVRPQSKYQNEGGPSPQQIVELLRAHSEKPDVDVATFTDALIFNWVIGGSDGHAKNYSLLHGAGGGVRLAPLYDVASALPYPSLNTPKLALAMKMGGEYRLARIGAGELRKLAESTAQSPERVLARGRELADAVEAQSRELLDECVREGLRAPVLERLVGQLGERTRRCAAMLEA